MNNIELLLAALRSIAAYDDKPGSERLEKTGSFGAFDEPGSVEIAREALEKYDALESKLPEITDEMVLSFLNEYEFEPDYWLDLEKVKSALKAALSQQLNQPDGICPNCSKPLGSDEFYHAGYDWDNYRTIPDTIGRGKYCDHVKRQPDENEMASTPGGIR